MDLRQHRSPALAGLSKGRRITALVLTIVIALVLGSAGAGKVAGQQMQKENFEAWDLPLSLMPVVGATEIALAVLLLVPPTRFWGAAALGPWMVGAIATHLRVGQYPDALAPVVIGALGLTAAWLLWPPALPKPGSNAPRAE